MSAASMACFVDGGEMGRLFQAKDWSATTLGPISAWPQCLRTALQMTLVSPFPNLVLWGPDLLQLYNDAYRDLMGSRHPAGLGQPTRDCWPEMWEFNEPIYQHVFRGESASFEDRQFRLERSGTTADAWFTLSYSPIRDVPGEVAGVLVTIFETTERVQAQKARQATMDALRESEAKYRAIFNSINEGFSLLDIQFDEKGDACDVIIRDANPAQDRIDGVRALIGKRVRELLPDIESKWIDRYADVVRTGMAAHFEDWSEANQR